MNIQSREPRITEQLVYALPIATEKRNKQQSTFWGRLTGLFQDNRLGLTFQLDPYAVKPDDAIKVYIIRDKAAHNSGIEEEIPYAAETTYTLNILEDLTVHQNYYTYQRYYTTTDSDGNSRTESETVYVRYLSVNLTESGFAKLYFIHDLEDNLTGPHYESTGTHSAWYTMAEFIYLFYVVRSSFMQRMYYNSRIFHEDQWTIETGATTSYKPLPGSSDEKDLEEGKSKDGKEEINDRTKLLGGEEGNVTTRAKSRPNTESKWVPIRLSLFQPVVGFAAQDLAYSGAACCSGEVYKHGALEYFEELTTSRDPVYEPKSGISSTDYTNLIGEVNKIVRSSSLRNEFGKKYNEELEEFERLLQKADRNRYYQGICFFIGLIFIFAAIALAEEPELFPVFLIMGLMIIILTLFGCIGSYCFGSDGYHKAFRSIQVQWCKFMSDELRRSDISRLIYEKRGIGMKFILSNQWDAERGSNESSRLDYTFVALQTIRFPMILLASPNFDAQGRLISSAEEVDFLPSTAALNAANDNVMELQAYELREDLPPPSFSSSSMKKEPYEPSVPTLYDDNESIRTTDTSQSSTTIPEINDLPSSAYIPPPNLYESSKKEKKNEKGGSKRKGFFSKRGSTSSKGSSKRGGSSSKRGGSSSKRGGSSSKRGGSSKRSSKRGGSQRRGSSKGSRGSRGSTKK